MEYPVKIEGAFSADGRPLELLRPPSIVKQASEFLASGSRILDVGAYHGTNGFFLTEQGHTVDSVEINDRYIKDGENIARILGSAAMGNRFIHADFRWLTPDDNYDAAIATNVLTYMSICDAYKSIYKLQQAVRPGGLNVVSVYIADDKQKSIVPNLNTFSPGILKQLYTAGGWEILFENEEIKPIRFLPNPVTREIKPAVASFSEIIAKKPRKVNLRSVYLGRAASLQNINPEQAAELRRLAADMPD